MKYIEYGVVVVLAVILSATLIKPVSNVVNQVSDGNLGAVSGPDSFFNCETHNGVTKCFAAAKVNQASTTVCSLKSPSGATSTLTFGKISVTTGTTTALFVDVGQSSFMDATTTVLNSTVVPSGQQFFINATTTTGTGKLVFAPNTYFNVKYGGAALGSLNTLVGTCSAEWMY